MFSDRHPLYNRFKQLKGGIYTIEGIIGVGKTTAGRSLEHFLIEIGIPAKFYPEYMNKDLLEQYIFNMKRYAYAFQMIMLCKRIEIYREAERLASTGCVVFIDRSIMGDMTFARMQKNNGYFTENEWKIYLSFVEQDIQLVPTSSIFLKCSPESSLDRVKQRGIESEIKHYSLKYMRQLEIAYQQSMRDCHNVRHIMINWNTPSPIIDGYLERSKIESMIEMLL
jgi:deoxyadenosine/deoxycytidine kinase